MKNYLAIYNGGHKPQALLTMQEMEASLSERYFPRVYKSFFIAVEK